MNLPTPLLITWNKLSWALVTTRKRTSCTRCHEDIKGSTKAFRPITQNAARGKRLCAACGRIWGTVPAHVGTARPASK